MLFKKNKKSQIQDQWLKRSYSQSGEDLIVKFIFDIVGIESPSYLDVGAHHPYYLNNTALFYESGSRGINIEPDPNLFEAFLENRPEDINLNIGIGQEIGIADFYLISAPTLNTFSQEQAEKYKYQGDYTITDVIKLPINNLGNVLTDYYGGKFPDFLNIDAEGVDEMIVKSIDFTENFPSVICVETLSFSSTGNGIKNTSISDYLIKNGYMLYADTNINTILVRRELWQK